MPPDPEAINVQTRSNDPERQEVLRALRAEVLASGWGQESGMREDELIAFQEIIEARGGITGNDKEDLKLVCAYYSTACQELHCASWVRLEAMDDWRKDLEALIENEEKWIAEQRGEPFEEEDEENEAVEEDEEENRYALTDKTEGPSAQTPGL